MAKALTVKRIEKLLRVPGKYTDGDVRGLMLCVESKKAPIGSCAGNATTRPTTWGWARL